MRAYGLPRVKDVEYPDLADIITYGLKSSVGRCPGKCGVIRSLQKSKNRKRSYQIWKKRIRKEFNNEIRSKLCQIEES